MSDEDWYLASASREGTHFGRLEQGAVHARCGREFAPQTGLFGGSGVAVAVLPMQAQQACRQCCAQLGIVVGDRHDIEAPAPNRVRRDQLRAVGVWVKREPGATVLPPAPEPPPVPVAPLPIPGGCRCARKRGHEPHPVGLQCTWRHGRSSCSCMGEA